MNREALLEELLKDPRAGFETRAQAQKALTMILKGIERGLKQKGKKVVLSGFGTFRVVKRKARDGVNPVTGEKIRIPASSTVKFKLGDTLKNKL